MCYCNKVTEDRTFKLIVKYYAETVKEANAF